MGKIVVEPVNTLQGEVTIDSAKNAVLKIMAATLLAEGEHILENVPNLTDVQVMADILRHLGSEVTYDEKTKVMKVVTTDSEVIEAPYELTAKMRASFTIMGPLLAKKKQAKVFLPGGCSIGARPVDLHLKGFRNLGADIHVGHGYVEGRADNIQGNKVYLDFPSVGATENIMMLATLGEGTTVIYNAAQEPEIVSLSSYLSKMGAKITGAGTSVIKIQGVKELKATSYQGIPDRIEAGSFMIAAAITRSEIKINNVVVEHLQPIISKLTEAGVRITEDDQSLIVNAKGKLNNIDITTLPYPGFPTDMQSQFMTLMTTIDGTNVVKETVFENRFLLVKQLVRMGANIKVEGSSAVVQGGENLEGSIVEATDLRGGLSLILAGLVADGKTEIHNTYHIDRGYSSIEEKFRGLGAKVYREA